MSSKHRCALFGLVPANQALHCRVDTSLGRPPQSVWKHRPGRSCNSWLDQIHQDSGFFQVIVMYDSPAWIWSDATVLAGCALVVMMMMIICLQTVMKSLDICQIVGEHDRYGSVVSPWLFNAFSALVSCCHVIHLVFVSCAYFGVAISLRNQM